MKFSRITEEQAYARVVEATKMLHDKGIQCKEIANHPSVKELGLNLLNCTTSGYGLTGEGEYSALFVSSADEGYKVYDIFVDILSPGDTSVNEISKSLGRLNPEHKQCDIRDPISMEILYHLELFGKLPERYKRFSVHS